MAGPTDEPAPPAETAPPAESAPPADVGRRRESRTMIPGRDRRPRAEAALMRFIATLGIVGIGVAVGAILAGQDVAGWIVGLAVSGLTVVLCAVLWSSRRL
jgi:hypothetical protein